MKRKMRKRYSRLMKATRSALFASGRLYKSLPKHQEVRHLTTDRRRERERRRRSERGREEKEGARKGRRRVDGG